MANYVVNAYASNREEALKLYYMIAGDPPNLKVELWHIERDAYGNTYVVITRDKRPGKNPKIRFLTRVKP